MLPSSIDLAVLLVFFTRKDTLEKVFARIREARPSELFLYQDGPRSDHPEDAAKLEACRAVVEQIDWECKVHRLYQEKNYGPDASGYLADRWAFSQVDKCLVLEDDAVPARSFFAFCKEMLDRYEHDERVMLISGWNLEEETQGIDSDYFFSAATYTLGWASWGRVVRQWDAAYSFLDDAETKRSLQDYIRRMDLPSESMYSWEHYKKSGGLSFECALIAHQHLHRGLTIYPRCNMVCHIGIGGDAAHYQIDLRMMARGDRRLATLSSYELDVAHLKHPQRVENHPPFSKRVKRLRAVDHPIIKTFRCLESFLLQCRYGDWKTALRTLRGQAQRYLQRLI